MSLKLDVIFTVIASMALSAILAFIVLAVLPGSVTISKNSLLETRNYQAIPQINGQSLADGQFQSQFESAIADSVPYRDKLMLANAYVQRKAITVASTPFGFDVTPTFYGSERVRVPSVNAIYLTPYKRELYSEKVFDDLIGFCSALVEQNADIQWAFFLPDSSEISLANPAHEYVENAVDYKAAKEIITSKLPTECPFIDVHYEDVSDYENKVFRTDHHFQLFGSIDMYKAIVEHFGFQADDLSDPFVGCDSFYGTNAKSGLDLEYVDAVYDARNDAEGFKVSINGEKKSLSDIDKGYSSSAFKKSEKLQYVYGSYFHGDTGLVEIVNTDLPEDSGSLLLISDSYDNNCSRYFASHYRHVYELDPIRYKGSVQAFIDEHSDIVDAAFILCLKNVVDNDIDVYWN